MLVQPLPHCSRTVYPGGDGCEDKHQQESKAKERQRRALRRRGRHAGLRAAVRDWRAPALCAAGTGTRDTAAARPQRAATPGPASPTPRRHVSSHADRGAAHTSAFTLQGSTARQTTDRRGRAAPCGAHRGGATRACGEQRSAGLARARPLRASTRCAGGRHLQASAAAMHAAAARQAAGKGVRLGQLYRRVRRAHASCAVRRRFSDIGAERLSQQRSLAPPPARRQREARQCAGRHCTRSHTGRRAARCNPRIAKRMLRWR